MQAGRPRGLSPLQRAALGSVVNPYAQANLVSNQIAEQAAHRPLPLELLENQAHDALHLGVRVEDGIVKVDVTETA